MALSIEEKERRLQERRQKKYKETHKVIDCVDHKLCSVCKEWLPCNDDYFYRNKGNKTDGYNPYCTKCTSKKAMQWNKDNPERAKITYKKRDSKPERKIKAIIFNKRRIKNGKLKEWQIKNPDKLRRYSLQHRDHDISKLEWEKCKSYFNNECAYCGMTEKEHKKLFKQQLHKEHVEHDGANDISNCIPACKTCNSSKRTYTLEEWYAEDKSFYQVDRLNKIIKWLENDYKLN